MTFAPTCTIRAPHALAAQAGAVGGLAGGIILTIFMATTAHTITLPGIVLILAAATLAGVGLALVGNATGLIGCAGKALGTGGLYGAGIWALVQLLLLPVFTHGTIGAVTADNVALFNGYLLAGAVAGISASLWLARTP